MDGTESVAALPPRSIPPPTLLADTFAALHAKLLLVPCSTTTPTPCPGAEDTALSLPVMVSFHPALAGEK
jgi:hypothetical protein